MAKRVERGVKGYFSLETSIKRKTLMINSGRRVVVVPTRLRLGHCGLASYLNIQTVYVTVEIWKQSNMLYFHVKNM